MVTQRIRNKIIALWRVLTHDHILLFTLNNGKTTNIAFGYGQLSEIMIMAVDVKRQYNSMLEAVNQIATESGELHTVRELKKTLDAFEAENGGK